MADIQKLAYEWITGDADKIDTASEYYCQTRDVFQGRLEKMKILLLKNKKLNQNTALLSAVAGEIGNNSFDHNLGNWPDVAGVFFSYKIGDGNCIIVLADRGLGVLKTLQRVRPKLNSHKRALETAFTEVISARAPESRGNGLKFVRNTIIKKGFHLRFLTGDAEAEVNKDFTVKETEKELRGCLVIVNI